MCKGGDESSLNIRSAIVTAPNVMATCWVKVLEQHKPATKLRIL